jgi:hypothetical protein
MISSFLPRYHVLINADGTQDIMRNENQLGNNFIMLRTFIISGGCMKKLTVMMVIVLLTGLFSSCLNLLPSATLNQALSLKTGQAVRLDSENMQINFQEVTGDSRCPTGVVCIWAGQAQILVKIVNGETTYMVSLIEMGGSQPATQQFLDYKLTFDLQPYPIAGKTVNPADYRLSLTVTK